MPGGALFSAPMVASADDTGELDATHKAAINYWFRHIWEYWWPLYPGVLLAISYAGIPAALFYCIQIPFSFASIAGGYLFILRKIRKSEHATAGRRPLDFGATMATLFPIGLLVAISVIGSATLPRTGMSSNLSSITAMLCGLCFGLCVMFAGNTDALKTSLRMFGKKNTWLMAALVLGIQIFATTLSCPLNGTVSHTLVYEMQQEFTRLGIPILLVMGLIPLISGAVTGVAFGFVGASFPIVFALIGPDQPLHVHAAATTFAYGCGYLGMTLSPVHVCLVVTAEYFKIRLFSMYQYILAPSAIIFAACLIMSACYYYLF